ncbi:MAG: OsmC family protein [Hydrogenophaga sp.]|nr:OsmC family protein [Hydrogenophaga sp.]
MTPRTLEAQAQLRAEYKANPNLAMVTDHASTRSIDPADPFHSLVIPKAGADAAIPVGVHSAVGGPYDAPCPGDLLCAALAACQDSSIRMVAAGLGIELTALEVHVQGKVDVRGALGVQKDVPVGFQSIISDVHLQAKAGTSPEMLAKLQTAAERCCVVMQTLQTPPQVRTAYHM